ncbi:hypothetical protein FBUS_03642 [Fasciolopsis buskii]|uniref:G-protein coupled receptors family 1 profile domain-containing protein n=1 Tax=Fasciolopsis buskii TaxID=27845 RepID=A0A8E0RUI8_9TREM|nr:hypothetical protein FBUS_03642 [Fasciolopsis buski]
MNQTENLSTAFSFGDVASEFYIIWSQNPGAQIALWKIVPLGLLISWTVATNGLLTCVLVCKPELRTQSNLLVGHQAAVDLVMGLFSMTISATKDVLGFWPFSIELAVFWLNGTRLVYTVSVWSTAAIALDRYAAVAHPQWYLIGMKQKIKRTVIYYIAIWTTSFTICFPSLLSIPQKINRLYEIQNQTELQNVVLKIETIHIVFATVGSVAIPLILMIALYGSMLVLMRKKRQKLRFNKSPVNKPIGKGLQLRRSSSLQMHNTFPISKQQTLCVAPSAGTRFHSERHTVAADSVNSQKLSGEDTLKVVPFSSVEQSYKSTRQMNQKRIVNFPSNPVSTVSRTPVRLEDVTFPSSLDKRIQREKRATCLIITLTILVSIAWLPYTLMYLTMAFATRLSLQKPGPALTIQRLVVWNGCINAAFNPIACLLFNRGLGRAARSFMKPLHTNLRKMCLSNSHP